MRKTVFFLSGLYVLLIFQPLSFANQSYHYDAKSQADEESKTEEPAATGENGNAVKGIAQGVKQVAYDGPKELIEETTEEATKKPPIVNVVEGVNRGTQKLLDHTVKGAYKVATLGTSELKSYEIQEPEKGSGEPTKIKISIPGT